MKEVFSCAARMDGRVRALNSAPPIRKNSGGYVNRGMILQVVRLLDNIGRSSYRFIRHACGILSVLRFILTKSNLITIREN